VDRSASISQREDDLAKALVVSVVDGAAELIPGTIAHRFEMEDCTLTLHPFGPARFLLFLPSVELAERVFNGRRAIVTPTLRLHVMRWTRFIHSSASSLTMAVMVDLDGIPAHA